MRSAELRLGARMEDCGRTIYREASFFFYSSNNDMTFWNLVIFSTKYSLLYRLNLQTAYIDIFTRIF